MDRHIYAIERVLRRLRIPHAMAKLGRRRRRKLSKIEWESKDSRLSRSAPNQPSRQQADHFVPLLSTVHHLDRLEKILLRALEPHLRGECRLGKYEDGEMVVFCRDANLASHLRYHQSTYVARLKTLPEFGGLKMIKIRLMTQRTNQK